MIDPAGDERQRMVEMAVREYDSARPPFGALVNIPQPPACWPVHTKAIELDIPSR
jgi:hypothetical protein